MNCKTWMLKLILLGLVTLPVFQKSSEASEIPARTQASGVYEEIFTTHVAKRYVDRTVWDTWNSELRLGRYDAVSQGCPALAIDTENNAFVVWTDSENGISRIYAQLLDMEGNRVWAHDVQVSSSSALPTACPVVAIDSSGSAVIAWMDSRNGNSDVYMQRLSRDGSQLWSMDVRVNKDASSNYRFSPTVTSGNNQIIVAWTDSRNLNNDQNFDIYAQQLNLDGDQLWSQDVRVNRDTGAFGQEDPAVAIDRSGNTVVVWSDRRDYPANIYAQRLDSTGRHIWLNDVKANISGDDKSDPAVVVDMNGDAVIVWEEEVNDFANLSDIYMQRINAAGIHQWSQDIKVGDNVGLSIDPAIGIDIQGNATIAWTDLPENNLANVFAQRVTRSGQRVWEQYLIIHNATARYGKSAIAVYANGDFVVAWEDLRLGKGDIYAKRISATAVSLWLHAVRVNDDLGMAEQILPAVSIVENGNAVVAWSDSRNGVNAVYMQRIDSFGNKLWLQDLKVSSNESVVSSAPAIAADRNGNVIVVWADERNGRYNDLIYAQRVDISGNLLWEQDILVGGDTMGMVFSESPDIAIDAGGNAIVVWQGNCSHAGTFIFMDKIDSLGNRLWAQPTPVSRPSLPQKNVISTPLSADTNPRLALDNTGSAVVVWMFSAMDHDKDVYAQRVGPAGNPLWGSPVEVAYDLDYTDQSYPVIVTDGDNSVFVAWSDNAIYSQRLDQNGNRLWPQDQRINDIVGTEGNKNIVAKENEAIWIVWEDSRNGDLDIYSQKINRNGDRLWTQDICVNCSSSNQKNPTIALHNEDVVVVWEDDRANNADLYIQKTGALGMPIWDTEIQVVTPDMFYLPEGTAESNTIDGITENIQAASLIADHQLNGGHIAFLLTNDGGTHWAEVTPGVTHVFTSTGSDLRWRAVLTGDPLWRHRSPVVHSLRIEYSSQILNTDDYEPDDTCAQARPVAVNGALQAHTLHQYADADWVWFEAAAGKDYVVQATAIESNADLKLELYDQCGQPPVPPDDEDTLGNDARLVFTAPVAGVYYIKATNTDPLSYGADTEYRLSVRVRQAAPLVVIVAGRNNSGSLDANIRFMGDQAYRTFRRLGVPRENLRYLSVGANRDADQDGYLDVDGVPSWLNMRYAIQDWPRERGLGLGVPFYLYLVDHGGTDYYCALSCTDYVAETLKERVSAADLHLWLSNLEATTGADEINVIIEACHSGSFIDVTSYGLAHISGHNRVIIASTGSDKDAYPSEHGGYFSDAFFTTFGDNADLWTAYEAGRTATQRKPQTPWLDDNGDAVADGRDGALARGRGLLALGEGSIPIVQNLTVSEVQDASATLQVIALDDVAVVTATVEIFPPGFTIPEVPEGETPVLNIERVRLSATGNGTFEGTYTGFTEQGIYRLVAYVWDSDGNLSLPHLVVVGDVQVFLPLVLRN